MATAVVVKNPIIHHSCNNERYTTYEISLKSSDICFSLASSSVRRRFSDFVLLQKMLRLQHPNVSSPSLPSRNLFRSRFTVEFIEQRGKQLEKFLQQLLEVPLYLSSKGLHLFLQSNLSMAEIEAQVSGVVPPVTIEKEENPSTITNSSMLCQHPFDTRCEIYGHTEGTSSGSPDTCSNSLCINNGLQSSVPILPCKIDKHVTNDQVQLLKYSGCRSKNSSPCSSYGSTRSFPCNDQYPSYSSAECDLPKCGKLSPFSSSAPDCHSVQKLP